MAGLAAAQPILCASFSATCESIRPRHGGVDIIGGAAGTLDSAAGAALFKSPDERNGAKDFPFVYTPKPPAPNKIQLFS
jgi:hypothetical protein